MTRLRDPTSRGAKGWPMKGSWVREALQEIVGKTIIGSLARCLERDSSEWDGGRKMIRRAAKGGGKLRGTILNQLMRSSFIMDVLVSAAPVLSQKYTPGTKPIHAGKNSWGINFFANTCGACIRTRANTGKYF